MVVKEAMMMPLRRCQTATKFKKVIDIDNSFKWLPTFPSDSSGVNTTLFELPAPDVKAPDIDSTDIFAALARTKPSVSEKDLHRYVEFTEAFG